MQMLQVGTHNDALQREDVAHLHVRELQMEVMRIGTFVDARSGDVAHLSPGEIQSEPPSWHRS
jgi:hypothetical protein